MKLKQFVQTQGGQTRDYHQIDPRLLQVRPDFNIRDLTTPAAREKLDILKAQIRAEGVLEPLEIEFDGETPWINEGHRRHIVVMELIEEGEAFKTIPCVQERNNIKADKRTLHMLMRSKEDYEPLEYAKGLDRMVNVYGWDKATLATALGFKSKASIDGYLDMLGMTDAVKEQVAQGEVSATVALKVTREARDAKTDPAFAAEIIAAAAAEQKALGKKGRATPKAVKRVSERAKPKAPEPKTETLSAPEQWKAPATVTQPEIVGVDGASGDDIVTFTPLSEMVPPERVNGAPPVPVHPQLQEVAAREVPAQTFAPPSRMHDSTQKFFAIIARLATIGEGHDLNALADDHVIEVPAEVIKAADRAYRDHIGDA